MRQLQTNYPTRKLGTPVDKEAIKRHAFADQGVVVVSVNDTRLDDFERQFLKNIGLKIFGPKRQ
ncbi:hypothetical protein [Rhodopseudomonas sp. B29]|uniref:hypothetical protein n=1 Tax=Rhodopseudomonas sp. B29 TaxID=95607 RepID=UPI00034A6A43|nr:hypothetical protein [Rhodopseudomonas sp. B29]